jgi:hypothetical protein
LLVHESSGDTVSATGFRLPRKAHQGEPLWYILDVTIQVEFDPLALPDAKSYVSVLTNGYPAALVRFSSETIGEQRGVEWSSRDLFIGRTTGLLFDRSFTLRVANYLQRRGVQPGHNELSLRLEHLSGPGVVTAARLLPGSGVAVGSLGPPALRLQGAVSANRVRAGGAD